MTFSTRLGTRPTSTAALGLSPGCRMYLSALAAIFLLAAPPVARAQKAATDADPAADLPIKGDALAGADGGFAPGEVPLQKVPFQQPATQSAEVPQPPANDPYGLWTHFKSDIEKKTGTTFELYFNPSDQAIVNGPNHGTNRATFWYNFHVGQQLW